MTRIFDDKAIELAWHIFVTRPHSREGFVDAIAAAEKDMEGRDRMKIVEGGNVDDWCAEWYKPARFGQSGTQVIRIPVAILKLEDNIP